MLSDPTTFAAVDATSGVHTLIACIWRETLDLDPWAFPSRFSSLCHIIHYLFKVSNPANLAELVEGSGGTLYDLAGTIRRHIRCLIPVAMDRDTLFCFVCALRLIDDIQEYAPATSGVLLSRGIITPLLRALHAVDWQTTPQEIIAWCMDTAINLATADSEHRWIVAALRAGLLHITAIAILRRIPLAQSALMGLLTELLPAHMVYHTVLAQIDTMSPALNTLIDLSDPSVVDNPLLGKWQAFYNLMMERL
jgi:hypothetical protein